MANMLSTDFTHTYAGKELLTEVFYQPQHDGSGQNPFDLYRVMSDVKTKKKIYVVQKLAKIVQADTGCGFSASGNNSIQDRIIDPVKLKVNLEECEDAFNETIFAEAQKSGVSRADLTGTAIEQILLTATARGIREDLVKMAWFGNAASADSFYGNFDSFFEKILSGTSGTTKLDLNSSATYEAGGALASDGALAAMRAMYSGQGSAMRSIAATDKKYYVTSTVYDNLQSTLEATGADSGLNRIQDGGSLKFRGSEVVDMSIWDAALDESGNPNSGDIGNNAIVYTTPDNLIIGTDVTDPASELKVWFDEKDEKVYIKSKFNYAVQIVHDELVSVAY